MSGGDFIAGTGTMNLDGTVGAIGGIRQKEITARRAGATIFLAPAENCPEALTAVPAGLAAGQGVDARPGGQGAGDHQGRRYSGGLLNGGASNSADQGRPP